MLFTFVATKRLHLRILLTASMVVVAAALVLTFSRGAFAGFIIVNILFLIAQRRFFPLLIGALLLVGMVFMLPEAVFQRLSTGVGGNMNAVTAGRTGDIWLPLLPEVLDSPVIGHGLGSILWSEAMRSGRILTVTHPHNAYLQALLDTGVAGLILIFSFFAWAWRRFRALAADNRLEPERRGFYAGAAAGLAAFLITGMAGSSLMPVAEQSLLWLAIGMMWGESANARLVGDIQHA
jgi:O-antigen ligase